MTSAPPREHGHRPGHAPDGDYEEPPEGISKVKAVILLVVAVLLGIGLLHVDRGPVHGGSAAAASTSSSTTAPPASTTTTTAPVKPSAAVKVLVANGHTVAGAATFFTHKLSGLGWGTLNPVTTTTTVSASAVYYASGQQGAAQAIAASLGLQPSAVQPLSSSVPVSGVTGASVVLVVGPDLGPQVTAGG